MNAHGLKIALFLCLLGLLAHVSACTVEEATPTPADVPVDVAPAGPALELLGDGLTVDGTPLLLGTPMVTAVELLGAATQVRAMGLAGTVYSYPALGLELWASGDPAAMASIHLLPEYTGGATGGLVPGAAEAMATEMLGAGVADPFALGRHYPERGLFVGIRDGKVELLTLGRPE